MATLVLQAAGQAAGGLMGPIGGMVGRAAGSLAGSVVDQRLFGDSASTRSVGRLADLSVQTASEGNPIPRCYGRVRIAGTVIWAADFVENVATTSQGGKGGGAQVRQYSYSASFAVGLCEGPIARIARVWADGEPMDLEQASFDVYRGSEDQDPDPLIEAMEGGAPAYRGLAYVVFKNLPIGPYGNRLPQLTFEVVRPVGHLETMVRAVTMIPAATEFGYGSDQVDRIIGPGQEVADNRHLGVAKSDLEASLDELQELCPNIERVALVVAWFGDDLRVGHCTVTPRVERRNRKTDVAWSVAGEDRQSALLVTGGEGSEDGGDDPDGPPAYGGTPSDASVVAAIQAIKARGLKVVFYPFILMDVPEGNGLPDPYGAAEQSPFPWRGRITVSPAAGQPGTIDGTAAADDAVAKFVGTASPDQFSGRDGEVFYDGPREWTLRRMILHYAALTAQAGGVDAFLVGSELRGLTQIRGANGFPFVESLSDLVDDVRQLVGIGTKISYAADWSEYFGYQPAGTGDVYFHLDGLWANDNVDFVGIDNYWPLSDWRDGTHIDGGLASSPNDRDYLSANIAGGEGYDWFYADEAARFAQRRSPIADEAYGEHWVFRYKDLAGWWSNRHHDRLNGVKVDTPTGWLPGMKPVWFTEVGCPAVDRGANQPNVFYDPKSSESRLPYFSSGRRDDGMQRAYLEAMLGAYALDNGPWADKLNPRSGTYEGRMIDPSTLHVWTWDARPWPAFPHRTDVWSDGPNWERGHWLTGRLGGVPVAELLETLFEAWGLPTPQIEGIDGVIDGFLVPGPTSLRDALEPFVQALSIVAADTGTEVSFSGLGALPKLTIRADDLVALGEGAALVSETREEAANLPVELRLRYLDSGRDYQIASARHRPGATSGRQTEEIAVPACLNDGLATELAETALSLRLAGRTQVRFALSLRHIGLVPGDTVTLSVGNTERDLVIEEIEDYALREVTARTLERNALRPTPVMATSHLPAAIPTFAAPVAFGINLPTIDATVAAHLPWIGVFAKPFPGEVGVWRAVPGGSFQLVRTLTRPATLGEVTTEPKDGPTGRMWRGGTLDVRLYAGMLASVPPVDVLSGRNAIAVQSASRLWEVLQFERAELVGERRYRLSNLLRGQLGTEDALRDGVKVGAPVVVLDGALETLPTDLDEVGLERVYRVGPLAEGIGGRNVTTFRFTPTARGLLPYAPAHGAARLRADDGALLLSWIRRSRAGGDPFRDGLNDVPLVDLPERYRLEILSGSQVVRTEEALTANYTYSLTNQLEDFGASPDRLTFRVAQISQAMGAGSPYEVTVDVKKP